MVLRSSARLDLDESGEDGVTLDSPVVVESAKELKAPGTMARTQASIAAMTLIFFECFETRRDDHRNGSANKPKNGTQLLTKLSGSQ